MIKKEYSCVIEGGGPSVTQKQLQNLETDLGASLPVKYRNFLETQNGGSPKPNNINVPGSSFQCTDIQQFFGLNQKLETSEIMWNFTVFNDRFSDKKFVPLACDSGGSFFTLARFDSEEILYFDISNELIHYKVADDIYQLLDCLF